MYWMELLRFSLITGTVLSIVMSVLIIVSLKINPEMWWQDYPEDVREKWGPMSEKAKRQRNILIIPLFGTIIGGLVYSGMILTDIIGESGLFIGLFTGIFIIVMNFNLVDAFVLDLLIPKTWPALIVLPGTEGMAGYTDMRFWFTNLVKSIFFAIFSGLLTAGIGVLIRVIAG